MAYQSFALIGESPLQSFNQVRQVCSGVLKVSALLRGGEESKWE
jgi:hypothetical protein